MTLDHVFIAARPGADEELADGSAKVADRWARSLIDAGFTEGSGQRHPGQGTANRRFFFEQFMLELLYVDDEPALDDERGRVLALRRRFTHDAASPFGFGCRPTTSDNVDATFAASAYHPAYLPDALHIDVAGELDSDEPLLFHLPFLPPFDEAGADDEPREHPNGANRLKDIVVHGAGEKAAHLLSAVGVSAIDDGSRHRLALVFGTARATTAPTRPVVADRLRLADDLPLTISIGR